MTCRVRETVLGRRTRGLVLENDQLSATVLVDKGADVYRLEYLPAHTDVMWKSPWGLREPGSGFAPAPTSEVAWLEHYEGGWQELFPNGGDACTYKGVELPYHGEASALPWEAAVLTETSDEVRVRFSVRLYRSPFRLERTMSLRAGSSVLTLDERITNEGAEPLDAMWSHHPALGAPFLDPACLIDTDARSVWADPRYDTPGGRVRPGGRWAWPHAEGRDGARVDLRRVPDAAGDMLAYLGDFVEGWYAVTNPRLGFGVGLVWPARTFPHAWLWQELRSSSGFPWYRAAYTMAIEPASSVPGQGLAAVIEQTGAQLTLEAGESRTFTLRAVFFPAGAGRGVEHIASDGTVTLRQDT